MVIKNQRFSLLSQCFNILHFSRHTVRPIQVMITLIVLAVVVVILKNRWHAHFGNFPFDQVVNLHIYIYICIYNGTVSVLIKEVSASVTGERCAGLVTWEHLPRTIISRLTMTCLRKTEMHSDYLVCLLVLWIDKWYSRASEALLYVVEDCKGNVSLVWIVVICFTAYGVSAYTSKWKSLMFTEGS